MAHFAKIDDNNIVLTIAVVDNDNAPDEATGIAFCKKVFGSDTNWVQTSYNTYVDAGDGVSKHRLGGTPFRRKYAGIGDTWDAANQQFVEPS
jgi:hypothetical protein